MVAARVTLCHQTEPICTSILAAASCPPAEVFATSDSQIRNHALIAGKMPPVGLALPEERAGSIFGNGNGIHNLDQAAVKPTAENVEEPTVICLDVLVKSARVVSVEHVCAHIAWSKPEYADDAPHRPDLPEIKCIRFEVDWVSAALGHHVRSTMQGARHTRSPAVPCSGMAHARQAAGTLNSSSFM